MWANPIEKLASGAVLPRMIRNLSHEKPRTLGGVDRVIVTLSTNEVSLTYAWGEASVVVAIEGAIARLTVSTDSD